MYYSFQDYIQISKQKKFSRIFPQAMLKTHWVNFMKLQCGHITGLIGLLTSFLELFWNHMTEELMIFGLMRWRMRSWLLSMTHHLLAKNHQLEQALLNLILGIFLTILPTPMFLQPLPQGITSLTVKIRENIFKCLECWQIKSTHMHSRFDMFKWLL